MKYSCDNECSNLNLCWSEMKTMRGFCVQAREFRFVKAFDTNICFGGLGLKFKIVFSVLKG